MGPTTKQKRRRRRAGELLASAKSPAAVAAALGVSLRQAYHYRGVQKPKPRVTLVERRKIARILRGHSRRQAVRLSGRSRKVVDDVARAVAAGEIRP